MTELDREEVGPAIETLNAREVLHDESTPVFVECLSTKLESWIFDADYSERALREHFKLLSLDGCGLAGRPLAIGAAGAILHYLRDTQKSALDHLDRPSYYDRAERHGPGRSVDSEP